VPEPVKKSTRRKTTYKNADNKTVSELLPKTENQKAYIDAIDAYDQVIVLGPAVQVRLTLLPPMLLISTLLRLLIKSSSLDLT
jgi:HrpA-like RNA helicase